MFKGSNGQPNLPPQQPHLPTQHHPATISRNISTTNNGYQRQFYQPDQTSSSTNYCHEQQKNKPQSNSVAGGK